MLQKWLFAGKWGTVVLEIYIAKKTTFLVIKLLVWKFPHVEYLL
jgi:hypothetical protein